MQEAGEKLFVFYVLYLLEEVFSTLRN